MDGLGKVKNNFCMSYGNKNKVQLTKEVQGDQRFLELSQIKFGGRFDVRRSK